MKSVSVSASLSLDRGSCGLPSGGRAGYYITLGSPHASKEEKQLRLHPALRRDIIRTWHPSWGGAELSSRDPELAARLTSSYPSRRPPPARAAELLRQELARARHLQGHAERETEMRNQGERRS